MENLAITTGPVPAILYLGGIAALAWLVWGSRRHLLRWVPAAVLAAALLSVLAKVLSEQVWNLWGAPLPDRIYVYAGLGLGALLLAAPKMADLHHVRPRLAVIPVSFVAVLAAASLVNQDFEYYPTLGSLFGYAGANVQTLDELKGQLPVDQGTRKSSSSPPTRLATWHPPANMPTQGTVVRAVIPAPISHEASSTAFVYLPPAYLGRPRAELPVLVLIHGVPGGPIDWLRGGRVAQFMDDYSMTHKGLAPIVVMPDAAAGGAEYPPACMNSRQGQAGTYLSQDVPTWVKQTFGAGKHSSRQWAIGGFSYGGTCAMQLAMNYPGAYPTFIDSSGEDRPTIRQGHRVLLQQYFDGSAGEFRKQNALDVIKTRRYPSSAGIITVGAGDPFYKSQGVHVYRSMKKAGIKVQLQQAPGGHVWTAWKFGVEHNMDWLMTRLGVTG